jgi:hypothetical protein
MLVVVLQIHLERLSDLPQVGEAGDLPGLVAGLGEDGEEQRREDGDDSDDDEQLDEREGGFRLAAHATSPPRG